MAEAFGIVAGACGLADKVYSALKEPVVRGKKAAQDLKLVTNHINVIGVGFERHTPHFNLASLNHAVACKQEVEDALTEIKQPPTPSNPSTIVAKLKDKAFLMCYGIRHGKEVERKLVALRNKISAYEVAVRPSGGKTRHAYIEGSPDVILVSKVGCDRADKVIHFVREWKALPINAAAGASSFKLCFVGIVGHSGLGKSILMAYSLSILEKESKSFEIVAYVELSDKLGPEDLKEKQASLINQLLKGVATYEKPQTHRHGSSKLKEVFQSLAESGKSVCITIDNVWEVEDLQKLLPDMTIPSFTCCIMVTSQVQNIVEGLERHCAPCKSDCCHVQTFKLEPLSKEDSKRLLVAHARGSDEALSNSTLVDDEVSKLAEEIYPFCCNLPKALKLTGDTLATKMDPIFWDRWKEDMAEGRPGLGDGLELLDNLLDRGYQKLDGESQAAVCGIAACFNGWPKQTAINIVGNKAIDNIENYSLLPVDVPVESTLKMQVLIRKLAQACAESRNDIKWGLEPNWLMSRLQREDFEQVKYLQLNVRNAHKFGEHLNVEGSCFLHMRHLLALDMLGPFNCTGLLQFPESLRFLRFQHNHCLQKVFESVKFPSRLQQLELDGCTDLMELPATAYNCGSLIYLRVVGSPYLRGLRGTNSQWMSLKVLCLEDCPSITQLPLEERGKLQLSVTLNCEGLKEFQNECAPKLSHVNCSLPMPSDNSQVSSSSLPPAQCDPRAAPSAAPCVSAETFNAAEVSISQLHEPTDEQVAPSKMLTISQFNEYSNEQVACLTMLTILARDEPEQIFLPSKEMNLLKQLKLKGYGCYNLERSLFAKTSQLTKLGLTKCHYLTELDDSLGSLKHLEELILKMCHKLEKLPDTIGNLQALKRLCLEGCGDIQKLPDTVHNCVSLEELSLELCPSLKCLPQDMVNLKSLKIMRLNKCKKLKDDLVASVGALAEHQLDELELFELYSKESEVPDVVRKASRKVIL